MTHERVTGTGSGPGSAVYRNTNEFGHKVISASQRS